MSTNKFVIEDVICINRWGEKNPEKKVLKQNFYFESLNKVLFKLLSKRNVKHI